MSSGFLSHPNILSVQHTFWAWEMAWLEKHVSCKHEDFNPEDIQLKQVLVVCACLEKPRLADLQGNLQNESIYCGYLQFLQVRVDDGQVKAWWQTVKCLHLDTQAGGREAHWDGSDNLFKACPQ